MEGQLISEDQTGYLIKTNSGQLQIINKKEVDLAATEKLNPRKKVFTNEDLKQKYGASAELSPQSQTQPQNQSQPQTQSQSAEIAEEQNETEDWLQEKQRISAPYLNQLKRLVDKQQEAAGKCTYIFGLYDSGGNPVPESARPLNPLACEDAKKYMSEILELKEKARVAGVPMKWLDAVAPEE